jgi:Domain of unknown function (DUF4386)
VGFTARPAASTTLSSVIIPSAPIAGYVDPKLYVAGNASVTAANVVSHAGLVRLGVVAHLLDGTFVVFLAMTLYVLLQHVQKSVAREMLILVALSTAINP